MRKLVYGTLALGAAMAVAFGANVKDADAATAKWEVQLTGDTLNVRGTDDDNGAVKKILVAVPSISAGKSGSPAAGKAAVKVAAWDAYDANLGGFDIDVSKYSIDKVNYIAVKADYDSDAEALLIEIPQSYKLSGGKADAKSGQISFTAKAGTADVTNSATSFEYYTDNSPVKSVSSASGKIDLPVNSLKLFQQMGSTVYLRETGTTVSAKTVDMTDLTANDGILKTDDKITVGTTSLVAVDVNSGDELPVVEVGRRPSKALKANISKLANAPKATIDYVKGIITVPAAANYRFGSDDSSFSVSGVSHTGKMYYGSTEEKVKLPFNVGSDIVTGSGKFYLDVQTSATNKAAAGKWGRVIFNGQTATALNAEDGGVVVKSGTSTKTETSLVTAKFYYTAKGYGVQVFNNDVDNAYRVEVLKNGASIEEVSGNKTVNKGLIASIAKAGTTKVKVDGVDVPCVNPKNAKADVKIKMGEYDDEGQLVSYNAEGDLTKITIKVERLGVADKVNPVFPGTATFIPNDKIERDFNGDKDYEFTIDSSDSTMSAFNNLILFNATTKAGVVDQTKSSGISKSKGDQLIAVTFNSAEATALPGKYSGLIDAFNSMVDQTNGRVTGKGFKLVDQSTKKAVALTMVKVGGNGEDKNNVLGFTFKMPKAGVKVTYVAPAGCLLF